MVGAKIAAGDTFRESAQNKGLTQTDYADSLFNILKVSNYSI